MSTYHHPHQIVLLSGRFRYPDHRVLFSRARLFLDRIELSGWVQGKRHVRHIDLADVQQIDWDLSASTATFYLTEGASIQLQFTDVDGWRTTLEQRLSWSAPGRFPLASSVTSTARHDLPLHDLVAYTTSMG